MKIAWLISTCVMVFVIGVVLGYQIPKGGFITVSNDTTFKPYTDEGFVPTKGYDFNDTRFYNITKDNGRGLIGNCCYPRECEEIFNNTGCNHNCIYPVQCGVNISDLTNEI